MRSRRLVVYTALFGGYDKLAPLDFSDSNIDYVCFSDRAFEAENWTVVKVDDDRGLSATFLNRFYKMHPHLFLTDYDASIYVDANIIIKKSPLELFHKYTNSKSMYCLKHYERNCAYQEIQAVVRSLKVDLAVARRWYQFLRIAEFPEHWGLFANRIILRHHADDQLFKVSEEWWKLFSEEIPRDQLSLPFLAWKHDFEVGIMEENPRCLNEHFAIRPHLNQPRPLLTIIRYWFGRLKMIGYGLIKHL